MSMFLEIIHSEGLAHLSYIFGHKGQAVVVDPRRDARIYQEIAHQKGATITHIFETHRNEDYIIGSAELARSTGAQIYHGKALDFTYGNPVEEGDIFQIGDLLVKILETPGHTFESISLALIDTSVSQDAVAVFTGDVLFVGDVGRTDFFPGREKETAGLIYDSIFNKLLPLGDHVLIYPAHGAGSVCGSLMAEREFSSLGYERAHNPVLQHTDKDDFINFKVNEHHYLPPYFKKMEEYNLHGSAPELACVPLPPPLRMEEFLEQLEGDLLVLDVRSPEAIAGAFIPGSLSIPLPMIPAYAGYFLDYETDIALVVEHKDDVCQAVTHLLRIGYDRVIGFLDQGLHAWEVSGHDYDAIPAVHVKELVRRIEEKEDFFLLDVRKDAEVARGHLPGSHHIFLGDLPKQLDEIPRDKTITTFCGSGQRAIIAASILKRAGFTDVEDCLGSMAACSSFGCPIES